MTLQPASESSTYSSYAMFPSEPSNRFHAVQGEVFTEADEYNTSIDASFRIGWAGSLVNLRYNVIGYTEPDGTASADEDEVKSALDDLEMLHKEFNAFYEAAKSALTETFKAA